MLKMKPEAAAGKRFLRVQAEGAQGIHASDSKFSLDAKPDPYVVFVLGNVTHKCDNVNDVEPLKYFAWPNAIKDFEINQEKTLKESSLVIHVKDSDTIKDRYIGGALIPLEPLYAAMQNNVLCQSKMFTLEFADDKFKKRKDSGEVKLTITLIEEGKSLNQPVEQAAKEAPPMPIPVPAVAPPPKEPTDSGVLPLASTNDKQVELPDKGEQLKSVDEKKSTETQLALDKLKEEANPSPAISSPPLDSIPKLLTSAVEDKGEATTPPLDALVHQSPKLNSDVTESQKSADVVSQAVPTLQPDQQQSQSLVTPVAHLPMTTSIVKAMKIELVSARNLTRPVSFGAIFDRKPDPLVALEFYGMKKSSVALKDVDIKKPVVWNQVVLSFDLPRTVASSLLHKGVSPMDLIIHVKDENLLKPTYMGGTKVSLAEFFLDREESGEWNESSSAINGVERTYPLDFGDEKLSKRKKCGEITLRFYFIQAEDPLSQPAAEALAEDTDTSLINSSATFKPKTSEPGETLQSTDPSEEKATPSPPLNTQQLSSDVKMLSIEALCGRNLVRPSAGTNPKGIVKALFDRKPDPYVTFVLGGQAKKCPPLKDADVAFFEWHNAVQVFDITNKPYPKELIIHVRDEDVVGKDPYMAGAKISLEYLWEVIAISSSAEAELVRVYPLTFIDEQLTKQKSCGEITLRIRWVYSESPLPVIESLHPTANELSVPEAAKPKTLGPDDNTSENSPPVVKTCIGFAFLRNIALWNKDALVDSSLDLYVVASCFPPDAGRNAKARISASTTVLTDAAKGKGTTVIEKVEWKGEELVLPVAAFDGEKGNDFMVELRDKNAITKDTQVAELLLSVSSLIAASKEQAADITLELELLGSKKFKSNTPKPTVIVSVKFQFLPLGSPLLGCSLTSGIILTVFLVRSVFRFRTDEEQRKYMQDTIAYGVNLDYLSNQKKHNFLSFGKHDVETQTDSFHPTKDQSIGWRTCFNVIYSSKQIATAKDKDSLEVEVQLLQISGKKAAKCIGSVQLNLWGLIDNSSSSKSHLTTTQTMTLGENASMDLEFAVAYRSEQDSASASQKSEKPGEVSLLKSAVHVPSGNLHLLVVKAQSLVAPNEKEEKAEELDPEVRISIEPKYVKRKENPVRSMLKTRPLENAGVNPVWNEYLRLEYCLPLPAIVASDIPIGKAIEEKNRTLAETTQMLPPPIVQVGLYDIEVPGERNGSKIIGKSEIPLSAFLLTKIDPSLEIQGVVAMKIDIHLMGKKTGVLHVEGIFEPLDVEKGPEVDAQQAMLNSVCRSIGRRLSAKAKNARHTSDAAAVNSTEVTSRKLLPGRLEVHLVSVRPGEPNTAENAFVAQLWLNSSIDDRKEMKSKGKPSNCSVNGVQGGDIIWDRQTTFYAKDISTELLRVEILTLTGKTLGSLKLPLSGIQSYGAGQMARDWHSLIAPAVTVKLSLFSKSAPPSAGEIMIGVAFYPDQELFQPLEKNFGELEDAGESVIVLRCGRLVFGEETNSKLRMNQPEATMTQPKSTEAEVACKVTLIGGDTITGSICSAFQQKTAAHHCFVDWNEVLSLQLGCSARKFIQKSAAIGACPLLRIELMVKRKRGRFPEQIAVFEMALVGLFCSDQKERISKWCALYNVREAPPALLTGVLELEILAASVASLQKVRPDAILESASCLNAIPGVLCIRFIAGRNLIDVDPNGEQDPYVVTKIAPYFPAIGSLLNVCQTDISMNGGCHPQWNSPIFHLQVRDLRTDYVRVDVIDSNEEDHLADAYIGGITIATACLFPDAAVSINRENGTTKWLETWLPIYPALQNGKTGNDDISGEIRVDYRFISQDYFNHAEHFEQKAALPTSPYKLGSTREQLEAVGPGKFYFHVVRARRISCQKGMQPGVRIECQATGFSKVTKPAIGSIQDPVWDEQILEMDWQEQVCDDLMPMPTTVSVEIVDLAVRTANANAMAVITFSFVNVDAFLLHPTAASYAYHDLGASRDKALPSRLLLGCQFIPSGKESEVMPFQRKQGGDCRSSKGQLHVKILQNKYNLSFFFRQMMMNKKQIVRFRLLSGGYGQENQVEVQEEEFSVPYTAIDRLLKSDGVINWSEGAPSESGSSSSNALLFDCAAVLECPQGAESTDAVIVNPILICEIALQEGDAEEQIVGELEIPIFDFILLDGHLACSWYQFSAPSSNFKSVDSALPGSRTAGEIKLEMQYLPSLAPEKVTKPVQPTNDLAIISIEVKEAYNLPILPHQVCLVAIEMLNSKVETKPCPANLIQSSSPTSQKVVWNEILDFPVTSARRQNGDDLLVKIQVHDAFDSNTVIGWCTWVLPHYLLDKCDASENSPAQDGDVVLKLQSDAIETHGAKSKQNVPSGELHLSLRRVDIDDQFESANRLVAAEQLARRAGIFYFRLDSQFTDSLCMVAALLLNSTKIDDAVCAFEDESKRESSLSLSSTRRRRWKHVSDIDTSVLPVDRDCLPEKHKIVVLLLTKSASTTDRGHGAVTGFIELDSRYLVSATKSPKSEICQQLPVQVWHSPRSSKGKDQTMEALLDQLQGMQLTLRFKYVKSFQGQLFLKLLKLESPIAKVLAANPKSSFRVDMRFLHSKEQWLKSAFGVLNPKTNEIEWESNTTGNPIQLFYSNEHDISEPVLQVVLFRVENPSSGSTGVREAYGQISLLSILTDANASDGKVYPVQLEMIITGQGSFSSRPSMHLEVTFESDAESFEEKVARAAKEHKEKALVLAEGAAELKRLFAFMGGDEETPLKISDLKAHLIEGNTTDESEADKAREVLQHAADMETDGDIDTLFAAMDVNGDGMLSWDEYADHMQNIHALAHAKATQRQVDTGSYNDSGGKVEEGIANSDSAKVEEPEITVEVENHDKAADTPPVNAASGSLSTISRSIDKRQLEELVKVDEYVAPAPTKETVDVDVALAQVKEPKLQGFAEPMPEHTPSARLSEPSTHRPSEVQMPSKPARRSQPNQERVKLQDHQPPRQLEKGNEQQEEMIAASVAPKKRYPFLSSYVLDWKVEDVMLWLTSEMELSQYGEAFQKNAVNGKLLLTLTEQELESEMGVTAPLHKRKLMNQIKEYQDKFGKPQASPASPEKKRTRKPQMIETTLLETPSFLKREQLLYQTKQKALKDINSKNSVTGKGSESGKIFRATTRLVSQPQNPALSRPENQSESYHDAMQDIMESIRPHTPPPEEDTPARETREATQDRDFLAAPAFPLIQIGSMTNTDELFEIVKQRVLQLSQVLLPLSKEKQETFSDFGDDPDDQSEPEGQDDEKVGMHLVFHAFTSAAWSSKISRARVQDGLLTLLFIDVSWHQFDLLFRRLDVDCDGELSLDEFCEVFQRDHLSFQREDLLFLEDALVNFVIEKLETQQWTLIELFKAFDRDGGGEISIAEFATLARFLFTRKDKRKLTQSDRDSQKRSKRLVYLLMSCLDVSADRRISLQEFLRFFFVIWSSRLMEVQDQLFDCENTQKAETTIKSKDIVESLRAKKKMMRRVLRTNFSRPFRDSMRCVDVNMPSPFNGLLSRLQLLPTAPNETFTSETTMRESQPLQIWQVLQGQTSTSHRNPMSLTAVHAETEARAMEESRKRVQKGKNEVLRTRLTRKREPERPNAVLQTPSSRVALDGAAKLKFDHRNPSAR